MATLDEHNVSKAVSRERDVHHTEDLGYVLAKMQHLTRSHPEATW